MPESSLWGFLLKYLPYMQVMLSIPTFVIALQILADPYLAAYVICGLTVYLGYVFSAP